MNSKDLQQIITGDLIVARNETFNPSHKGPFLRQKDLELDLIKEVGIDEKERLYLIPSLQQFPFIYREAMEVHWDANGNFLYSPKPREWTYLNWYKQIISAAKEQSCSLRISNSTKWTNIPEELKKEILEWDRIVL